MRRKEPPIPPDIWDTMLRFLELEVAGRIVLDVAPGGRVRRVEVHGVGRRRLDRSPEIGDQPK